MLWQEHFQFRGYRFDLLNRLARAKSHPIYSDIELSTEVVVYLNIYQNFLLCAMKMHGYIKDWGLKANKNVGFLRGKLSAVHCIIQTLSPQ
jgi:hypothetical protein